MVRDLGAVEGPAALPGGWDFQTNGEIWSFSLKGGRVCAISVVKVALNHDLFPHVDFVNAVFPVNLVVSKKAYREARNCAPQKGGLGPEQDQLTSEQRKGLETRFSLSPSGLLLNRLFQLFLKTWISSQSLSAGSMLTSMFSHRSCLGTGQDFGLGQSRSTLPAQPPGNTTRGNPRAAPSHPPTAPSSSGRGVRRLPRHKEAPRTELR